MLQNLFLDVMVIPKDDPIAFTFFTGYMAMLASSIFFFAERGQVDNKWKLSLLVSALITGIAAVHYYYMRDYYVSTHTTPTALRYIDWTLTVPLMCIEFYLLLRPAGAKASFMWKLIAASALMLVAGYIGEAFVEKAANKGVHSFMWGAISTVGYIYILYSAWLGEAKQLADSSNSPAVKKGIRALGWFVLAGWAIYPIGYIAGTEGGLFGMRVLEGLSLDIVYNIHDTAYKEYFI